MHKIVRFTAREYKAAVKTKGFIIGLILAPLFMGGSLIAFFLLKDRVDTTDKHIAVIDRSGRIVQALVDAAEYRNTKEIFEEGTGKKIRPAYFFERVELNTDDQKAQLLGLSDRVRKGELYAFLDIGPQVVHPGKDRDAFRISYYAKNAAVDDVRSWISGPVNNQLRRLRLADAGINETEVKDLFSWISVDGMGLLSVNETTGNIQDARKANPVEALVIPIVIMMLMLLMIMMSVPGMLQSVMEEKTQRIAEVLLGSIKPFEFMSAKLLSGMAVSLTSSAVYIVGAAIALHSMGYEDYVPFHVLPWFVVYMLFAIVMFGAISAALGSTCSEAKDAQSLSFPTIILPLFPMFIYFPVVREPLSSFATWASLIPPFTPLLMVLRLSTPGGVPAWQPYVGLVGVVLCTLFFVWAGGRIFRVAILTQGTPPKLANIVRWAIRG